MYLLTFLHVNAYFDIYIHVLLLTKLQSLNLQQRLPYLTTDISVWFRKIKYLRLNLKLSIVHLSQKGTM